MNSTIWLALALVLVLEGLWTDALSACMASDDSLSEPVAG